MLNNLKIEQLKYVAAHFRLKEANKGIIIVHKHVGHRVSTFLTEISMISEVSKGLWFSAARKLFSVGSTHSEKEMSIDIPICKNSKLFTYSNIYG